VGLPNLGDIPLPGNPFQIPLPGGGNLGDVAGAADDVLVKDERVPLSKLMTEETGWRGAKLKEAMAITGAESSYDVNAENSCCVGLMQMNVDVHQGKFGIPVGRAKAVKWLKNPRNNLSAAYKLFVSVGGSWQPWEGYTGPTGRGDGGEWRKFVGKDPLITVSNNSLSDPITDAANSVVDAALGPLDEIASAILSPSTWFRVGKGALGGTMLIIGIAAFVFVVASKSNTGKAIQSAVIGGSPVGKAAKAASAATGG